MRAAVDIGTNSILLAVGEAGRVVLDRSRVVGLGRGLAATGRIRDDRVAAAEAVLADYRREAREHGVDAIVAVATAIARRAANWDAVAPRLEAALGAPVRVITGEEEARLTWRGALAGLPLPPDRAVAVLDLGGGSLEVARGRPGAAPSHLLSLPVGAVTITEATLGPRPERPGTAAVEALRADVRRRLARLASPGDAPAAVVGVGGTITTLAAMHLDLDRWEADRVHGLELRAADLAAWARRLARSTPAERRHAARCCPERADLMIAGTVILDEARRALGAPSLRASTGGLRHALLVSPSPTAPPASPP